MGLGKSFSGVIGHCLAESEQLCFEGFMFSVWNSFEWCFFCTHHIRINRSAYSYCYDTVYVLQLIPAGQRLYLLRSAR